MKDPVHIMEKNPVLRYDFVNIRPDRQIDIHSQNTWELDYIIVGSGFRTVGDSKERFSEGEVVLVPPEIPHCWSFDGERVGKDGKVVNATLVFNDLLLDRLLQAFPILETAIASLRIQCTAMVYTGSVRNRLARILEEMRYESEEERVSTFLKILLLLSNKDNGQSIGIWRKVDPVEQRMMQIRTFVSCNISREFSLQEVASHVGMNMSAFCTFFKRHSGTTFIAYVNQKRLDMACQLLKRGGMPVSEVCSASGFGSPAYFSRLFRKTFGIPPSQYARMD